MRYGNQSESTSNKNPFLSYYTSILLPVPQKSINPPNLPSTRKNTKHSHSTPLLSCPVLFCPAYSTLSERAPFRSILTSFECRSSTLELVAAPCGRSQRRHVKGWQMACEIGVRWRCYKMAVKLALWAKEMRDERDEVPNVPPPSFSCVPTSHDMSSFLALRISLNLLLYNIIQLLMVTVHPDSEIIKLCYFILMTPNGLLHGHLSINFNFFNTHAKLIKEASYSFTLSI